ncbi:hypothetical protein [Rhodobacter capsulatus]|uniref:hypothetical protein n=1 Tax=Rhodobacter capsulatus TaxID=1061 RepID=UPI0040263408
MHKIVPLALVAALLPVAALAEGSVRGAELGFTWSGLAEGQQRHKNNLALEGAVEYGFTPGFAAQLDVAQHHFTNSNDEATNVTLHAIGHVNDGFAVGGFLGHEWVGGNHMEHYGLEATHDFGLLTVEGNATLLKNDGNDATILGLDGRYALTDALSLGGRVKTVNADHGSDTTAFDATLGYAMPSGVKIDGSLGLVDGNQSDRELTVGLGVKLLMGGNGVTFGKRGLSQSIIGN